ncbi:MAG: LPS assembly lipoprotein LptE [Hyphococcus sp.]
MTIGTLKTAAFVIGALAVSSCGFKPLYATTTPDGGSDPLTQQIAVRAVAATETITPFVTDALNARFNSTDGGAQKYDLYVTANERAQRLAVQIDATVTRYNYRLRGRYTLVDLDTGKQIRGSANAVTSYNIVSSQYSTLFAERAAQQKAARMLAEEIERDLLLRFAGDLSAEEEPEPPEFRIDPRTDTPVDEIEDPTPQDPFRQQ